MKPMLRIFLFCLFVFCVTSGSASSSTAQTYRVPPLPLVDGYHSGRSIFNPTSNDAEIILQCPVGEGTVDIPINTIPPGGSDIFSPPNIPNPNDDNCVTVSNVPIVVIVNIFDSNRTRYASFIIPSSGSNVVSLPLLTTNLNSFNTWYSVMNMGGSSATVIVRYSDGIERMERIPVGAAKVFYQNDEGHRDNSVFAATIESDQPIVAAVIQESAEKDNLFAYTGFSSGATKPVFPLVQQNNPPNRTPNNRTGLQIQNIGTEATEVTLAYVPGRAGTACTETISINPGASAQFGFRVFNGQSSLGTSTCVKERFIGAARVSGNSANQPLVGIGNQVKSGVSGEAYGSFDPDAATNSVAMPLLMANNNNFLTGFAVQHVGGPSSYVICTYSDEGTDTDFTNILGVGEAFSVLQTSHFDTRFVGSGTCTAANADTKIVAVVNQLRAGSTVDQFLVYEGMSVYR